MRGPVLVAAVVADLHQPIDKVEGLWFTGLRGGNTEDGQPPNGPWLGRGMAYEHQEYEGTAYSMHFVGKCPA